MKGDNKPNPLLLRGGRSLRSRRRTRTLSTHPPLRPATAAHKTSAATRLHLAGRPLLRLSGWKPVIIRSIVNHDPITPPARPAASARGRNAENMAARNRGGHGSTNSHESPRSAHRTIQDMSVPTRRRSRCVVLVKRACYRSRRGFSTVAAPPIKLVVPFILESVPWPGSHREWVVSIQVTE